MATLQDLSTTITLNDGHKMPMFGFGTSTTVSGCGIEAIMCAVKTGYKMLDTAQVYESQHDVGRAIQQLSISREDIFITTKLDQPGHGYAKCFESVKNSLSELETKYVDLLLIHAPSLGKILETYDAMVKLKEQGLVRSIGVSNFGVYHLEQLRKAGRPTPAVNQIELNPYWRKEEIVKYCREQGIAVEGFCPMCRGRKNNDPVLVEMARRYCKSVSQLLIRWSVQKQYIVIPKSTKPQRILENSQVFDFNISEEDMNMLDCLPEERTLNNYPDFTESSWQP